MKQCIFIRHGKTKGNEEARYIGTTEERLSASGVKEMKEKRQAGYYKKADLVFVSPMKRCKQSADLIYPNQAVYEIPAFREIDFGAFEGKNYKELCENPLYQKWIDSNGTLPFPQGESRAKFQSRCKQGLFEVLQIVKKEETKRTVDTIAFVVHGGTIMAILDAFSGGSYFDFQCANGMGFICDWKEAEGLPVFCNIKTLGER